MTRAVNPWGRGAALALALVAASAACRPNPECYSDSECGEGQMCSPARGCVAFDGGVAGVLEPTWHEVVFPIIQQRCWGGGACHVRPLDPGIPHALETYADALQPSRQGNLIYEEMAVRVQDLVNPMPPRGQPQLNPQQIRFFARWAQLGAPEGDPNAAPDGGVGSGTVDAGVTNSGPLAMAGTPVEVSTGFFELSGPAWGNANNILVVTDRAQDSIFYLAPPQPPQVLLRPADEAVGLGSDAQGRLLMTQYGSRQVARVEGVTVTPLSQDYMGSRYNGPHDIVGRADGNVYFTDPSFGLGARPRELAFNGLFRLPPNGAAVVEWQGAVITGPAGLELSPDESALYVTDRVANLVHRFDVAFDGSLGTQTQLATTYPEPDGITVDAQGNIYVATALGVQGLSPQGSSIGLVALPEAATGVAFGGTDLRTLYVTTRSTLYSIQMPVAGVAR